MKSVVKNIFSKTPKSGIRLAGLGASFMGVGASIQFAPRDIIERIPDEHVIYVVLAQYFCYALGTFMAGAGLAQKEEVKE